MQRSVRAMNEQAALADKGLDAAMAHYQDLFGKEQGEERFHRLTDRLDGAHKELTIAQAELRRQFGLVEETLQQDENGRHSLRPFEVTHPDHGLLVSVDEGGKVASYDRSGAPLT